MKKEVEDLIQYAGTCKMILFSNKEARSILPDNKFDRKEKYAEY